jgi:nicotinate-nucleotide pyrophosphorylase (carboxylating)
MSAMIFHDPSPETVARLAAAGLDPDSVATLVRAAVTEDLGGGIDVTSTATIPVDARMHAAFVARAAGRASGIDVAVAVIETVCGSGAVRVERHLADGDPVSRGTPLVSVEAPARGLLTAERTALNLLCHLSGIATLTGRWVAAVEGTGAAVRDTRKTTPGLRALEKHAVRCGGGVNHRMSLSDAALVKDNHVAAAGGVVAAFEAIRREWPGIAVEVEVDDLDQLREVIAAGADVVLLDNMAPATMREAVRIVAEHRGAGGGRVLLEASGGLTLERAREVAETGVDYLAVGALTHSAPVLDIGLDVIAR